jgi:hypothetical protein
MSARVSLVGQRFGKLKVIGDAPSKAFKCGSVAGRCRCLCDCGKEATVLIQALKSGNTKSCGCGIGESSRRRFTTHGKSKSAIYKIWSSMIKRCENPKDESFYRYGGRGIKVCERWHDFEAFAFDMGDRPPGKSLDRISNDGNYEPSNVKWSTPKEQQRNMRSNHIITVNGITGCLTEMCERFRLPYGVVQTRIFRGWSHERAFFEPIHFKKQTPASVLAPQY